MNTLKGILSIGCLIFLVAAIAILSCQDENATNTPNNPPNEPSNPSPANLDSNVTIGAQLSWSCSDPDGDPMNYNIYLDTLNPPNLLEDRWPNRNFTPYNSLVYGKTYYWQIVARDINSAETEGPIWRFSTERGRGIYAVGTCQTLENALNVFVIRDEVYVAEGEYGVEIFDVSAPQMPIAIGWFDQPYLYAADVAVVGNYAFVADANTGLKIVDVSNPFNPYLLEQVNLPFSARAVVADDSIRVYVACDTAGLQIINVQYILSPFVEGSLSLYDAPAEAISIYNNYAFLGTGTRGIYVIDISDSENPSLVYNYETPGTVKKVHAVGEGSNIYVHVADGNGDYMIVDFTQPDDPQLLASLPLPGSEYLYAAHKAGQYAYLAANNVGLVITDDSIPPNILAYYDTPGQARGLFVTSDYIFVADGTEGVAILEYIE